MLHRFVLQAIVCGAAAAWLAVPAMASPAKPSSFPISGAFGGQEAGTAVAAAGDVNGDGLPDLVFGALRHTGSGGCAPAGSAYVVFGRRHQAPVDLAHLGSRGFVITGPADEALGSSVAGAGDVNGDGLDDVVIGAPDASPVARPDAGAAYVVFGRRTPSTVDVASPGTWGFRVDGAQPGSCSSPPGGGAGTRVSGLGDVNGDGLADVGVASPTETVEHQPAVGQVNVVFGKRDGTDVDLAASPPGGFEIDGATPTDYSLGIAAAGDVNRDHRADVLVTDPNAYVPDRPGAGMVFVVFGKADGARVAVNQLGSGGMAIEGAHGQKSSGDSHPGSFGGDGLGDSAADLGDINHDGYDDVALGAPGGGDPAPTVDRPSPGAVYVVRGRRATGLIDLAKSSTTTLINGRSPVTSGARLLAAGNVDHRGGSDVVIADNRHIYAVRGELLPKRVSLSRLGLHGSQLPISLGPPYSQFSAAVVPATRSLPARFLLGLPGASPFGRIAAGTIRSTELRLPAARAASAHR